MTPAELDRLRYPIGPQPYTPKWTEAEVQRNIQRITQLPDQLRLLVDGLDEKALQQRYRPGSWSIAQVVHHIADSHVNAYIRTRWCLTEEDPLIKPYDENAWSELPDAYAIDLISNTLDMIASLHRRWVYLLNRVERNQWSRIWVHPDLSEPRQLAHIPEIYSWHGEHHLGHIKLALQNS